MGEIVGVASVAYNLAGEEADRFRFLPSVVAGTVLSQPKFSMGEVINHALLTGPGIRLRSFYRWAGNSSNYGQIGLPTQRIANVRSIDTSQVDIPKGSDEIIIVQSVTGGSVNPLMWARKYLLENYPSRYDEAWTVYYDEEEDEIVITFPDTSTVSFVPDEYDVEATYIYIVYIKQKILFSPTQTRGIYIYKIGSGNEYLDGRYLFDNMGQFYPFIPIRIENKFLSDTYFPEAYQQVRKAYKKATGGAKVEDLITDLEDNNDLGDIDHAYVVIGTALNTKDQPSLRYLYEILTLMMINQANAEEQWQDVINQLDGWMSGMSLLYLWLWAGFSGPMPGLQNTPNINDNSLVIRGSGSLNSRYNISITWKWMKSGSGTGLAKTGAKVGELWFQFMDMVTVEIPDQEFNWEANRYEPTTRYEQHDRVRLYRQVSEDEYTYIEMVGMKHVNRIYNGHAVEITAKEAIESSDVTGFIIPLHYSTYRQLSLVDQTQMAANSFYLVLNCYEARKRKWYEIGIFRIIIVIIIAVIVTLFTGGAGVGLLGTHISIGQTLGFTGLTAAIVGSVINTVAAMIVLSVLEKFMTGLFGELGMLIASLFMLVLGQLVANIHATGVFTLNWNQLLRADNLLKLTDAVGKGIVGLFEAETAQIQQDWEDYAKEAARKAAELQQKYLEEFGYGKIEIDPMMLTHHHDQLYENSTTFLTRSLMTGSDIAQLSQDMIYNFAEYNLSLPNAFSS